MKRDCNETKVFLEELTRMCEHYLNTDCACDNCPMWGDPCNCCRMQHYPNEEEVAIVQAWSDEHPVETIEEYFNRILPAMQFDCYSDLCCRNLDSTLSIPPDGCDCDEASCRECWQRPYEESLRRKG